MKIDGRILGAIRDKKDSRDRRVCGIMKTKEIPKQVFSLEELFPSNNQFSRGSCTSQSQSHHKARQEKVKVSARYIMAKTKELEGNNRYGAMTRNTFKVVEKFGVPKNELYPEPPAFMSWEEYIDTKYISSELDEEAKKHKLKSYWRVNNDTNEVRQVLTEKKESIVISMAWYKEFNNDNLIHGKILPIDYKKYAGGHAVEITGFDDFKELLKIKNSWGSNWGECGFFYMPYEMFDKVVWDLWSSLDMDKEFLVDERYGEKRTWTSYLRERMVAFNPWLFKKIKRLPNNREIKGMAYGFWSYDAIFEGKHDDLWLTYTKPEAIKRKLI